MGFHNRKSKINDLNLRNSISNSLIGRYIGKDNPNYKGYINEKVIARGIFKTLSKERIRNSNYTCQICNKYGGNLETHHIKPFSIILHEFLNTSYSGDINNLYSEITNYSDFMNIKNLIVVCENCHHQIHYSDNYELSPFRWESATTIENT